MNVLHLSDTSLSGAPYRISHLLDMHSEHSSRHIQWQQKIFWREFDTDIIGSNESRAELQRYIDQADVIHYHNIYSQQKIFQFVEIPKKKSVLQIHSPAESLNVWDAVDAGIPIAVVAQYHPRQWPNANFIVPNVVDITDIRYLPPANRPPRARPLVSYAPSSANGIGWNDKSYSVVAPILKRMALAHTIDYQLTFNKPHSVCLTEKREADIGIDEVATGSYHLSSLEYLSMGICCICYLDDMTTKVVRDLTGCTELPWVIAMDGGVKNILCNLVASGEYRAIGERSRLWMQTYWSPKKLCDHYTRMYEAL